MIAPGAGAGASRVPGSRRAIGVAAWTVVLLVAALLLAATAYRTRDPDSRVYAGIAERLSSLPVSAWIAPEWWGLWGFTGPFREHPVGIFLLPAALGKLGYPAGQAAFAWNGVYQAASLGLAASLAAVLVQGREARALGWILQLLPIAFVFRIRANQEYAVLAGVLLALYATERSRRSGWWAVVTGAAFGWVLLVKGVFGLMVPVLCALWLAAADAVAPVRDGDRGRGWIGLGLVVLVVLPALTIGYEMAYRQATGESFLAFYTGPRLDPQAVSTGAFGRLAYQSVWYLGRLLWYAFPWSVVALGAAVVWWRAGTGWSSGERRGTAFVLAACALLIVAFAVSDRKADRFIFPAYFLIAGLGGVAAQRRWAWLARLADRIDRPWVPPAVWLALFLVRLFSGQQLPRWTFWRS